jgi:cell division protein ZapA (FtsZ GTPase activity inhibitor)
MSEVVLTVGGRKYTLRCEDGQEDHIRHLASVVDAKLGEGASQLPAMEAKNLLFAALFLADELEEARKSGRVRGSRRHRRLASKRWRSGSKRLPKPLSKRIRTPK